MDTFKFQSDFETFDEFLLDVGLEIGVVGGQTGEHAEDELLELGAREFGRGVAQRLRIVQVRVADERAQRLAHVVNVRVVARQHQRFIVQHLTN